MFSDFFYKLRDKDIPVSPTAFLALNRALDIGLVENIDDLYIAARTILIKSERYFDRYDQVFAGHFAGAPMPDSEGPLIDETAWEMLRQWLAGHGATDLLPGPADEDLKKLTVDELLAYFRERLAEQDGEHHGGGRWIGTGGSSPVGHSGCHPSPMRIEGDSARMSALQVAGRRRYRDYTGQGPLNEARIGEALKRLRKLVPAGAKDQVNIGRTIRRTVELGGEIEIVFERRLKDRLKVVLAIDNGGWSMDPHVKAVRTLFDYARAQFRELQTYFFHNTMYDTMWLDPARSRKPFPIGRFAEADRESRFIVVGDADMAPFELTSRDGSIHVRERSDRTSMECLRFLAGVFPHAAWLNPLPGPAWKHSRSIAMIREVFPMFELSLDGLEKAVAHLAP